MLRGRGLELRSASSCALAISSCLQAALAERSDGSERSEAKQKSSLPPFNPPAPYDAFKVATLLCSASKASQIKKQIYKFASVVNLKNVRRGSAIAPA